MSEKKSDWDLKARRCHLGVEVDLEAGTFRVPEEKVKKVENYARELYREAAGNKRWVSKLKLAKFIGRVIAWHLSFKTSRMYLAGLYSTLNSREGWHAGMKVRVGNHDMKMFKAFW